MNIKFKRFFLKLYILAFFSWKKKNFRALKAHFLKLILELLRILKKTPSKVNFRHLAISFSIKTKKVIDIKILIIETFMDGHMGPRPLTKYLRK